MMVYVPCSVGSVCSETRIRRYKIFKILLHYYNLGIHVVEPQTVKRLFKNQKIRVLLVCSCTLNTPSSKRFI